MILQIIIGVLLGFIITFLVAGRHEGDKPKRSLRFLIGKEYVHIHHWIYCSIILIVLFLVDFYNPWIYGILIGAVLQGFTYRDWHYVFYRKSQYKKIYSQWK